MTYIKKALSGNSGTNIAILLVRRVNMNTPKTTDNLLTLYMNDIKRYPLLSPEEETELAEKAVAGDAAAREKLININGFD